MRANEWFQLESIFCVLLFTYAGNSVVISGIMYIYLGAIAKGTPSGWYNPDQGKFYQD